MNNSDTRLADWAIKKIQTEFHDDVCLLLEHKTLKFEKDIEATTFSFYIPATNRAKSYKTTPTSVYKRI